MISQSERLRHFRSNYLNLIILPTEACNFRCTYCYETFENKKMPRPVVTGIKSLIDRRGEDLDELEDVPSRASGQYQLELGRCTANK